ncbi:MAG: arylsulfatase [Carboxylicivirga sp.]|nr:arylsulfatase [Carboxylicivirga sp.]
MKSIAWILSIVSLIGCATENVKESEQPNIVLILADDLGFSDLGCYGGEIATPNLDELAETGIRFSNFYNAGRCCPTRASLLTGRYPHQAGVGMMVYNNWGGSYQGFLNSESVTLAEVMKEGGYKTLMSGKWHVGHKEGQRPNDRGFDRFYGINIHVDSYWKVLNNCEVFLDGKEVIPATSNPINALHPEKDFYTTDVFTDYAMHFLSEETQNSDQPFFLYLAYNAPHFPLEAPDEDIAKYQGKYMKGWDELRRQKLEKMKQIGIVPKHTVLSPSENAVWDTLSMDDKMNLDFRRAMYAAQIDRLDQNVGRLITHLKEIGKYDNTIILFLSDNGCSAEQGMFGMNWENYRMENYNEWKEKSGWSISQGQAWANVSNVPYRMYKIYNHEGGIATPLIVHWPDKIKNVGGIESTPGHVIDIMTTLADVGGVKYPVQYKGNKIESMEGKSLLPLLKGEEHDEHSYLFWEHFGHRAVRKGNMKLVSFYKKEWELYNLENDPTELNNIVDDYPEIVEELKSAYLNWAKMNDVRDRQVRK